MTRTYLRERQARKRQEGQQDAANRCTFCKRELPRVGVLILLTPSGDTLRYCRETCRQDHLDALHTMEARR